MLPLPLARELDETVSLRDVLSGTIRRERTLVVGLVTTDAHSILLASATNPLVLGYISQRHLHHRFIIAHCMLTAQSLD
jgi:hypothetical protein